MRTPNDTEAIKLANLEFYRAFESLDLERMAALWVQDGTAKCVHPGWQILHGWEFVRESWQRIFENAAVMHFTITGVDVVQTGEFAFVTCTENLISVVEGRVTQGKVQATNIFERRHGRWLLLHHHGSPVMA